jgi:hypothetical protein
MKIRYAFAALATLAIAVPSIASAEEIGIRVGGDRDRHEHREHREFRSHHAEMRVHRDYGRHRDHDRKVVIIKHRHHDRD